MNALAVARNKKLNFASTCQNMVAKRNLVPPLRALQSVRASSTAFALSAELRLAQRNRTIVLVNVLKVKISGMNKREVS